MIRAIHADLIAGYGGSHGLRDLGLLESALARPEQLAHYEPDAGVERLAAVLGWGLLKNHAFLDGNKRVALAAVVTFLKLNGYALTCSEVEETAMVLRAAASEIDEAAWTDWVIRSVKSID
ncbi:death-on-curing protein [Granulicella arctica]|uniref:Death-on-curing protein n=2 Tax=Granulicella arctica TaxID=940613 RepID=A0A7Y9PEN6_9BACT|nr:death-on-curing protein [Granulicella arctica]